MKLSERLEALVALAEPTHDAERDHSAPDAECVFVDTRPAEFEALLREAAELARRVEGAEVAHVEPKNGLAVMHERCLPLAMMGQRVRLVPEASDKDSGNG